VLRTVAFAAQELTAQECDRQVLGQGVVHHFGMSRRIKFTYRTSLDVVIAEVDWALESEDDVLAWYEEYKRYFSGGRFDRKVDLILELSRFHVHPRIGTFFGEHRAKVLSEFTRRSYRVNQGTRERTFMYTSSAIHGAPANHFTSLDDAIAAMMRDREGQ
jgi:hypothetical protein